MANYFHHTRCKIIEGVFVPARRRFCNLRKFVFYCSSSNCSLVSCVGGVLVQVKVSEERRRQLGEEIRAAVVSEHGVDVHHLVSENDKSAFQVRQPLLVSFCVHVSSSRVYWAPVAHLFSE